MYVCMYVCIYVCMYVCMYVCIYAMIIKFNPCFNLVVLHNNLFGNQGSQLNKNETIFYVLTYCLLRKLSSSFYSGYIYTYKQNNFKIKY